MKATAAPDWQQLKFFKATENWGDASKMYFPLLWELERLRVYLGIPFFVSCGTQGEHSPTSLHPLGCAADILFPEKKDFTLLDIFHAATRFDFTELGIYSHWTLNKNQVGGLHIGMHKTVVPKRDFWIASLNDQGKQIYHALTEKNLIQYVMF